MTFTNFASARDTLAEQYVNAWHNDEAYARYDALKADTLAALFGIALNSHK